MISRELDTDGRRRLRQTRTFLKLGTALGFFVSAAATWSVLRNNYRRERAEAALRASEEKYRMLIHGVQDYAIIMLDPQGQILSWSAGAERIKGYDAEQIIGRNFSCFFPLEDIAMGRPNEVLRMTIANGHLEEQSIRVRKDGSRFLANLTFTAQRDPNGNLLGFSELSQDLSKSVGLEAKYRGLLEAAPDAIVVVTSLGEIILLNMEAEKQFDYRRNELVGQPVKNIIPDGFMERLADALHSSADSLAQGNRTGIELLGRRRDGSEFPIEIMLSPLESADGILVTAVIRNISARKHAQEELKASNVLLAESNQELEAFTYTAAHDLRAPLRHMHGFVSLLHQSWYDKLDENGRHYVAAISTSAKQMGILLDDLLNFSQVGRSDMRQDCVSLNQVVKIIRESLEPELQGRALTWEIGELPEVEGDATLLHQALFNLIANAVKYTRMRDQARIEIGSHYGTEGNFNVFVRDNGAGFEMQHADKLFHVFQRLHRAQDFEGTGIGLAIVRRIVERHGGKVWAESVLGRGATFYISLPNNGTK